MDLRQGDKVRVRRTMPTRRVGRKRVFPFWRYPDVYEVVGTGGGNVMVKSGSGAMFVLPGREVVLVEKAPVPLVCPRCGRGYKTERGLERHIRSKHLYFE